MGNRDNFWVLLWNLQFVHYVQPKGPFLRFYLIVLILFYFGLLCFALLGFALLCISSKWFYLSSKLPEHSQRNTNTGHRRFPTEETDPTTQQVQPSGSATDSNWSFAVFFHSLCPYGHLCFPRPSSFWSFLPSFRSFFPREPELKGKSVQQFPSPCAVRISPTHTRETKTAELFPMVNIEFHGAIQPLPSLV